jgi:hypothetical protein
MIHIFKVFCFGGQIMPKDKKTIDVAAIPIERIVFGVRYQPHYKVMDEVGAIIDRILRSKGTQFGPPTFPSIIRQQTGYILLNDETKDSLTITESDAILQMKVDSRKTSDIEYLADNYATFVLDTLRNVTHLESIIRYGVVFQLQECHALLQETPVEHFIKADFHDARSLNLRFTRRLAALDGVTKKKVNDYKNLIYTIKQTEKGEASIWLDYQEIFKPELDASEWSKRPFAQFVNQGINYFLHEFQSWLSRLMKEIKAA